MKSYSILTTALALATLASSARLNVHDLEDLVPRDIDPKTMDPTRLSVLSVLRTAIPSGSDFPKPTGDFEPDWYKNLPADVKSLLPSLYPATLTLTSTSTTTSIATVHVSAAAPIPTSVVTSEASSVSSVAVFATALASSYTSLLTLTKTLQYAPSASGLGLSVNSSSTAAVLINGTLPTSTSAPPAIFSGGVNSAMEVDRLAIFAWMGLATGIFLIT